MPIGKLRYEIGSRRGTPEVARPNDMRDKGGQRVLDEIGVRIQEQKVDLARGWILHDQVWVAVIVEVAMSDDIETVQSVVEKSALRQRGAVEFQIIDLSVGLVLDG